MENNHFVLDSYALLCYFGDEDGADDVQDLLNRGRENECTLFLNVVNLAEIYYSVRRQDSSERASEVLSIIEDFPINLEQVDKSLALVAANFKAKFAVALADCFCAATAFNHTATIVTGDPDFEKFEGDISIKWLPRKRR
ncbi:MAG: type II toxin-antitoxin system VapC family toxin [bacterium]